MKLSLNTTKKEFTSESLGINMLYKIVPKVTRDDGISEPLTVRLGRPEIDEEFYQYIADIGIFFEQHIDIDTDKYTMIYDMGCEYKIDNFYVGSKASNSVNYSIGEFEIYASNSYETLLNEENKILYYDNYNKPYTVGDDRTIHLFFDATDVSARFIAFRQLSSNATDMVSRIRNFGCFSNDYTKNAKYLLHLKKRSDTYKLLPTVISGNTHNAEYITNGLIFADNELYKADGAKLMFELKATKAISDILIIGKNLNDAKLFISDSLSNLFLNEIPAKLTEVKRFDDSDRVEYALRSNNTTKTAYFGISFEGADCELDQVLAYHKSFDVNVDFNNVITDDFLGVGANVIPGRNFIEGRTNGHTEQYMELEKRRLRVANPKVIRLWFQLDWFINTEEGYINRYYNFDSDQMRSLYEELDVYKEIGTEIELNYGWKTDYSIAGWFGFPDVFNKRCSAPRDLEHFATSCSDLLKELIINRGYTNIKHLSFYNEPNSTEVKGIYGADFELPEEMLPQIKEYYAEMVRKVDAQLKEDGIRDLIKIWVAETSDVLPIIESWTKHMTENIPNCYEYYCYHLYKPTYDMAIEYANAVNSYGKPSCVTEAATYVCGYTEDFDYLFEKTNVSALMGYINGGNSSILYWTLSGTFIPGGSFHNNAFWPMPTPENKRINEVTRYYYEYALYMNYIKSHSKIYKTTVSDIGDMYATVAESPQEDISVFVNLAECSDFERELNINFGKKIGKKFYKHIYKNDVEVDGNLVVPPAISEIDADDSIKDTVSGEFQLVLYTTIPPMKQVVMENCEISLKPGESVKLNAKILNGENNEKLKWSMATDYCSFGFQGSITEDGVYTASKKHDSDFWGKCATHYAVKAECESGEYGIAIIKVSKC